MRIGIYGLPQAVELEACFSGLAACGYSPFWRNHNVYRANETEDFAFVVLSGLRSQGGLIREDYNRIGRPAVIIDYGYLRRVSGIASFTSGHWQVGVNRLGWVPPFSCPSSRFDNLEIDLTPVRALGERIYVCGQHVGDPSHGLDRDGVVRWAVKQIDDLRLVTGREIVWRPHPDSPIEIGGIETSIGPMDWDDARAIITINSNTGLEALMNGVPVVCRHDAPYAELASEAYSEAIKPPSRRALLKYLHRVAYSQWTIDEVRDGVPFRWMKEQEIIP